ncbi:MAG: EamA family transporter [Chitinivibrionales bacterium]|nr:EamA family transporter [Chitinivibrionales bacterium]
MLWTLLTLCAFTFGGFSGSKCSSWVGGIAANRWRITLSLPIMIMLSLVAGGPFLFPTAWLFFISGILHIGIGDTFLYTGYNRIGPRLTMLIALCSSPIFSWSIEVIFLRSSPGAKELAAAAVIICGVVIALAPAEKKQFSVRQWRSGIAVSILAGTFMSISAVLTRYAMHQTHARGIEVPLIVSALYRVAGGTLFLLIAGATVLPKSWSVASRHRGRFAAWLTASVIIGPVLGMAAYHEALERQPSAVVQAVLSMMPVVVIPIAWIVNKDRPGPRTIAGALLSAGACAALVLM